MLEGGLHGFALRINDRFLGCNNNFGFHLQSTGIPTVRKRQCCVTEVTDASVF
jgi:hypothetical protein